MVKYTVSSFDKNKLTLRIPLLLPVLKQTHIYVSNDPKYITQTK
jgi:hypothetical protein